MVFNNIFPKTYNYAIVGIIIIEEFYKFFTQRDKDDGRTLFGDFQPELVSKELKK